MTYRPIQLAALSFGWSGEMNRIWYIRVAEMSSCQVLAYCLAQSRCSGRTVKTERQLISKMYSLKCGVMRCKHVTICKIYFAIFETHNVTSSNTDRLYLALLDKCKMTHSFLQNRQSNGKLKSQWVKEFSFKLDVVACICNNCSGEAEGEIWSWGQP